MLLGIAVHSYEQNAVNFPGWFALSASAMFSFQTVLATSGDISALTGGPPIRTLTPYSKMRCTSSAAGLSGLIFSGCAAESLLIGDAGSLASFITPTYSEWSVTPAQSSGVSILTS